MKKLLLTSLTCICVTLAFSQQAETKANDVKPISKSSVKSEKAIQLTDEQIYKAELKAAEKPVRKEIKKAATKAAPAKKSS